MIVRIDLESPIPLYRQLKLQIIQGILSGRIAPGERLPSVRQLSCDLGINLHTVHKAYGQLQEEGYLTILRNQGAVASTPPEFQPQDMAEFVQALYPLIVGMRARGVSKIQLDQCIDTLWERSIAGGEQP